MRLRKSFNLGGGFRLNLSKSGVGMSVGTKGFRAGVGSRGAYTTVGIPGTGLTSTQYARAPKGAAQATPQSPLQPETANGCLVIAVLVVGLACLIAYPPLGVAVFIAALVWAITKAYRERSNGSASATFAARLIQQGKQEDAIRLLRAELVKNPSNTSGRRLLGMQLYVSGQHDEAAEHLNTYLASQPADVFAMLALADCWTDAGKYAAAASVLQSITPPADAQILVLLALAKCFSADAKPELAIETLRRAPIRKRALDEQLLAVHYALGQNYEKLGRNTDAERHYMRVAAVRGDYEGVRDALGRVASRRTTGQATVN